MVGFLLWLIGPVVTFSCFAALVYDMKFRMKKRIRAVFAIEEKNFDMYCEGRKDQVLEFENDRRAAFDKWRDEALTAFNAHIAAVHGDDPDSRPASEQEVMDIIHSRQIPDNVRGGMSIMGADGRPHLPQGLFRSEDVGEATAFWLLTGSAEAWTRLSIAVAAAQAMQAAE